MDHIYVMLTLCCHVNFTSRTRVAWHHTPLYESWRKGTITSMVCAKSAQEVGASFPSAIKLKRRTPTLVILAIQDD